MKQKTLLSALIVLLLVGQSLPLASGIPATQSQSQVKTANVISQTSSDESISSIELLGATPKDFLQTNEGEIVITQYNGGAKIDNDWIVDWSFNQEGLFNKIIQTEDGGYLFVGTEGNSDSADGLVVKVSENGGVEWKKTFGGEGKDRFEDGIRTIDGSFVLAGTTGSYGAAYSDGWIVKIDPQGNKVWEKSLKGSRNEFVTSITHSTGDGYIIAGSTSSEERIPDEIGYTLREGWVLEVDRDGNIAWESTVGSRDHQERFNSIKQMQDGYVVVGSVYKSDHREPLVVRLDDSGGVLWKKSFQGTNNARFTDVVFTRNFEYILVGQKDNEINQTKAWVVALKDQDTVKWQITLGEGNWSYLQTARKANDGGIFFATNAKLFKIGGNDISANEVKWPPIEADSEGDSSGGNSQMDGSEGSNGGLPGSFALVALVAISVVLLLAILWVLKYLKSTIIKGVASVLIWLNR